jgi:hypothetical protein
VHKGRRCVAQRFDGLLVGVPALGIPLVAEIPLTAWRMTRAELDLCHSFAHLQSFGLHAAWSRLFWGYGDMLAAVIQTGGGRD